jgi:hypothetical protein
VWEAVYIIDELLKNASEMKPDTMHADTQGQSLPAAPRTAPRCTPGRALAGPRGRQRVRHPPVLADRLELQRAHQVEHRRPVRLVEAGDQHLVVVAVVGGHRLDVGELRVERAGGQNRLLLQCQRGGPLRGQRPRHLAAGLLPRVSGEPQSRALQ